MSTRMYMIRVNKESGEIMASSQILGTDFRYTHFDFPTLGLATPSGLNDRGFYIFAGTYEWFQKI